VRSLEGRDLVATRKAGVRHGVGASGRAVPATYTVLEWLGDDAVTATNDAGHVTELTMGMPTPTLFISLPDADNDGRPSGLPEASMATQVAETAKVSRAGVRGAIERRAIKARG
jgi:hypothetical protein